MNWKKYYKNHLVSLHDAALAIKPGDCIWMGQASEIPYAMLDEMHTHMEDYHDVRLLWNIANCPFDMLFDPESKKHFKMSSYFCLPLERMSGDMGVMEYMSCNYDQFNHGPFEYDCNTVAVHLCPPDENGYCNFGCYGVGTTSMFSKHPRITKRIGFIDKTGQFPADGDIETTSIHVTDLDYICEVDTEMMTIPAPVPIDEDEKTAGFILPYIKSGDKIEIGWGGLGESILNHLREKEGTFEVYSEVACDSMAPLLEEGKITKIVACAPGACSMDFFKTIQGNPNVHFMPQPQTVYPFAIAQVENIVAINVTFMCDLLGQCCSEAQGLKPYSGTGGSFSYTYGATQAPGGRSFICLRSTYVNHDGILKSNIVPWLPEGSIVTTLKNISMYIVSEYGLADVYLKTYKDRIKALIKIAHPDFREMLKKKICTTQLINEEDFE